jgi:hypothetical protein
MKIGKPTIIISSIGRTGTNFFAEVLGQLLENATALHEPDVLTWGKAKGARDVVRQVRNIGARHLARKVKGQWSLVRVSDRRLKGEITSQEAAAELRHQREEYVASKPGRAYVESSIGYYGLMDVLPEVFEDHRAVYIIRDARDWVRSAYTWGEMYGKSGLGKLLGHSWPRADEIPNNPYAEKWPVMDRFERVCWAWRYLNSFAIGLAQKNPNAKVYRFEDIFTTSPKDSKLIELLDFATDLKSGKLEYDKDKALELLGSKVNQSEGGFPEYGEWTEWQREVFRSICE